MRELGPEIVVPAILDMLSSAAASDGARYVIAAVVVAGEARGHRFVVRRFEPHLDGPRRPYAHRDARLRWKMRSTSRSISRAGYSPQPRAIGRLSLVPGPYVGD